MKILKLTANYDGRYADYNGYALLPPAALGVMIQNFPLNENIPERVDLDELEGKHSECYADLIIEEIELDELKVNELNDLIKNADHGSFEIFFEDSESSLRNEMKDSIEVLKQDLEKLCDAVGAEYDENSSWQANKIARAFYYFLKEKYEELEVVSIQIKKSQLDEAKKILIKHGIEVV